MLDKIKNNYYVLMGISIFCLIVIVFTSSYAYFKTQVRGEGKGMNVIAGTIDLDITENSISTNNLLPISDSSKDTKAQIKDFTVKKTSNSDIDVCYNLYLVVDSISNNIKNSKYLKYELTDGSNVVSGNLSKLGYNSDGKGYILLAKNKYLSKTDTIGNTYKLKIWLSYDKSTNQNDLLNSNITTHIYASGNNGNTCPGSVDTVIPPTLYEQILADNPRIQTRTDFNTTFTETNTGTLYKATESIAGNTPKDVYYFAGDAKNNWVKFGTYASDGPIRGYVSATDTSYKEYSTLEECNSASSYNTNCSYAWRKGDPMYWRIIRTNYDGSIRLLYSGTSPDTTSGYIGKGVFFNTEGKDPMYVGYMYGTTGSLENNRLNTNDSTIKTYIDKWYNNNLSSYTKYISTEAVYCNDRELAPGQKYSTNSTFYYAPNGRLYTNKTPTYNCTNIKDAFSGNNSEAKLTYPIGLMTADEIMRAGGRYDTNLPSPYAWYYLNSAGGSITGSTTWLSLSPDDSSDSLFGIPDVWIVSGSDLPGRLGSGFAFTKYGVRPAISLKSCTLWTSGDGSPENPYEIDYDNSNC